jgi:hypothetical protein
MGRWRLTLFARHGTFLLPCLKNRIAPSLPPRMNRANMRRLKMHLRRSYQSRVPKWKLRSTPTRNAGLLPAFPAPSISWRRFSHLASGPPRRLAAFPRSAIRLFETVHAFPVIVAEGSLIHVATQVKWLYGNVCALQSPL